MRIYQTTVLLAISALFISTGLAVELPTEPMLRIETGMHTARINRIDTDANEKTLVTASDDKTVRVWDLAFGRLRQILRVPSDFDDDGKLYAVAITPDGSSVAAGGWTKGDGNKEACIYIFDPDTAEISDRITGLPDVINHLAFSPDGQYLAAALGAKGGLRIYLTRDWHLLAQDPKYGDASYWAAFANDGRLATVCYDGYVRLYDPDFQHVIKKKTQGGKEPFSVAFAPDGKAIAVGFNDSAKVSVLSADDLSFLYAPDKSGVQYGDISSVAWSADGNRLMAGGSFDDGSGMNPVRIWNNAGRGVFTDIAASQNTIIQIRPLKNGNIVFAASDPCWGLLDRQGRRLLAVRGETPDYRGIDQSGFAVSDDGYRVRFAYEQGGVRPAVFDLNSRTLSLSANTVQGMHQPVTQISECTLSQWQNSYSPKLNGKKIVLDKKEMSCCVAWAPDRKSFLLGTDYYLRRFDRAGVLKWKTATEGEVWGVNVSGNSQLVLAALADGSIRWYHIQNGQELLALFPHKDGKSWIVWTPAGYYAASSAGEDLIGWLMNRGRAKTPDFFLASRFRSVYHRPDVIAEVLKTRDKKKAVRIADADASRKPRKNGSARIYPPVVKILHPKQNTTVTNPKIILRYSVRSPSAIPVNQIRIKIDGRPFGTAEPVKLKKRFVHREIPVILPQRNCEVTVIAENQYAVSEPARISLKYEGVREKFTIRPKLYVLAVGVSAYAKPDLRLAYPAKDARDIVNVLKTQKGGLYRDVAVKLLDDPVKKAVMGGLEWIEREVTSKDIAMVFFAGHGVNDRNGNYDFLPADAEPEKLKSTCIPYHTIRNTVACLPGKALFFVDTCHSGNIMGNKRRGSMVEIDKIAADLASAENGVVVFASCTGRQYSIENDKWKNGAFTKALVEGLAGQADYTGDRKITINELDLYLSERVKVLTQGAQTPVTAKPKTIQDFAVVVN